MRPARWPSGRPKGEDAYLTDVITKRVNSHPNSRIDDLLPWAYPTTPALKDVA